MHRMIKRHWRSLAFLVVLLVPLSCILLTRSPLERRYARIRKGMTEAEVCAAMRRQPDVKGSFCQSWVQEDMAVRVSFDFDTPRRVTGKRYITSDSRRGGLFERLQQHAGKLIQLWKG